MKKLIAMMLSLSCLAGMAALPASAYSESNNRLGIMSSADVQKGYLQGDGISPNLEGEPVQNPVFNEKSFHIQLYAKRFPRTDTKQLIGLRQFEGIHSAFPIYEDDMCAAFCMDGMNGEIFQHEAENGKRFVDENGNLMIDKEDILQQFSVNEMTSRKNLYEIFENNFGTGSEYSNAGTYAYLNAYLNTFQEYPEKIEIKMFVREAARRFQQRVKEEYGEEIQDSDLWETVGEIDGKRLQDTFDTIKNHMTENPYSFMSNEEYDSLFLPIEMPSLPKLYEDSEISVPEGFNFVFYLPGLEYSENLITTGEALRSLKDVKFELYMDEDKITDIPALEMLTGYYLNLGELGDDNDISQHEFELRCIASDSQIFDIPRSSTLSITEKNFDGTAYIVNAPKIQQRTSKARVYVPNKTYVGTEFMLYRTDNSAVRPFFDEYSISRFVDGQSAYHLDKEKNLYYAEFDVPNGLYTVKDATHDAAMSAVLSDGIFTSTETNEQSVLKVNQHSSDDTTMIPSVTMPDYQSVPAKYSYTLISEGQDAGRGELRGELFEDNHIRTPYNAYSREILNKQGLPSIGNYLYTEPTSQGEKPFWMIHEHLLMSGSEAETTKEYKIRLKNLETNEVKYSYVIVEPDGSFQFDEKYTTQLGDSNNDGEVTVADLIQLTKFLHCKEKSCSLNADMNNDNILNIYDLALLKRQMIENRPAVYIE